MKLAKSIFSNIIKLLGASFILISSPLNADTLQQPPERQVRESLISTGTLADSFPLKITMVYVNGNRVTRADFIRMYIGLDTGMIYDSVRAAAGKRRLLNTNLFSKVDVIPIRKNQGVDVYIIVTELFYIVPSAGGDYIVGKYGERNVDKDGDTTFPLWYRLRMGLSIQNFRGRMETFSIQTSVWDDRALSLSWSKPFVPTPYFFGIGAGVHEYPDINKQWERIIVNGRLSGGRTMFGNSRLALSFVPTFSRIDTVYFDSGSRKFSVDYNNAINKVKEIYSAVGWSTDRRDRSYDPLSGWAVYTDALTNSLCTDYNRYLQLDGDLRWYHRGFFGPDHFAYRAQATIRTNNGGIYKSLYIGGDGSVRGFNRDQLGLSGIMNDCVVLSAEYRFPIWTMPSFDVWLLSDYSDMLKNFYLRFDGALIGDAGHIWNDLYHPFTERENGAGAGAGLRIMAPTLRRSACIDVAWGIPGTSHPSWVIFSPVPVVYLYLDTYF